MVGSLCWFYAKVAMAFLSLVLVFRLVETPAIPLPFWGKVLILLLGLRPIMGDLSHGNVNLFILLLVVTALYQYRSGRDLLCGVLLGLAIACKVTPALFIPYFVWKRSFRPISGSALGLAIFLLLVPGLYLGIGRNFDLLNSWYGTMIKPFVVEGKITTDHINQSLPGLVFRMGTRSPSFYEHGAALQYSNIADLDPRLLNIFLKTCMVGFALLVVWVCRTPTIPRWGWRLSAEYSLVILGMLLFSERTWKHHCVVLVLPFAVVVYVLATEPLARGVRWYLVGTLGAVAALMASTIAISQGLGAHLAKLAEAWGAYVWAYLLLTAAVAFLLRRSATGGNRAFQRA
jgi:hypothetical protein